MLPRNAVQNGVIFLNKHRILKRVAIALGVMFVAAIVFLLATTRLTSYFQVRIGMTGEEVQKILDPNKRQIDFTRDGVLRLREDFVWMQLEIRGDKVVSKEVHFGWSGRLPEWTKHFW
jgi:hypothetical protein